MRAKQRSQGFTIVELLIVIIVIAILAAISIVAYTGIQNRAYMSKMQSDFRGISQAVELYRISEGAYPRCPIASPGSGCNFSLVTPLLEVTGLPTRSPQGWNISYVDAGHLNAWAVRMQRPDGTLCKQGSYSTAQDTWWSSAPPCW